MSVFPVLMGGYYDGLEIPEWVYTRRPETIMCPISAENKALGVSEFYLPDTNTRYSCEEYRRYTLMYDSSQPGRPNLPKLRRQYTVYSVAKHGFAWTQHPEFRDLLLIRALDRQVRAFR